MFDQWGIRKKVKLSLEIPWSRTSQKEMEEIITKEKFDVAHIHNIFPMFSPSIYESLKKAKLPFVHTLHDFRLFCVNAFLFRNGYPCELCPQKSNLYALQYKCFQNSLLKTIPVYLMIRKFKKERLYLLPDFYVVLTEFAKKKFEEFGIPEKKLVIKPNFLTEHITPSFEKGNYIVFVGRLSEEKGIEILFKAMECNKLRNITLKIIGSGPLIDWVKKEVVNKNLSNVEVLGFKPHSETIEFIKNARFLIFPSLWYEGFPMTLVEAMAGATPVIASALGGVKYILKDNKTGLLVKPGDPEDLSEKIFWLWNHPEEREKMSREARREFESKYTPEKNYEILMDIYRKAIGKHKRQVS